MAVTAYKFAGTAGVASSGGTTWTSPNNAKADNGAYAYCDMDGYTPWDGNGLSYYLALTNFGFSASDIPVGATINGIEVVRLIYGENSSYVKDYSYSLVNAGSPIGSSMASGTGWPTSAGTRTNGGATNMLGTSLTQANIVGSTFGCWMAAQNSRSLTKQWARIGYVKIRVYYTEAPSTFVAKVFWL